MHGMKKDVDKSFGVRKPLWHFRETGALTLDVAPTRQEAEELVGNYQVIREPLYRRVPIITDDGTLRHEFVVHEDEQLNVRSDTGKVFGAVPEGAASYETHVRKATSDITRFKRAMLTPTTILADAAALALEAANV